MENDITDLMTVDELCETLKIGRSAAYRILKSGKLKCFRINRVWKIPRECVIRYIREESKLA